MDKPVQDDIIDTMMNVGVPAEKIFNMMQLMRNCPEAFPKSFSNKQARESFMSGICGDYYKKS